MESNMGNNCGVNALTLQTNGIKMLVVVTSKKQQYYLWRAVDKYLDANKYTKSLLDYATRPYYT